MQMSVKVHQIKEITCLVCGRCTRICPTEHLEMRRGNIVASPDPDKPCIRCGHCMASCASESIMVDGFNYEDFTELPESIPSYDEVVNLYNHRRSIRHFRIKEVSRSSLERVVSAAAIIPIFYPPQKIEITVLSSKDQVAKIAGPAIRELKIWAHGFADNGTHDVVNFFVPDGSPAKFTEEVLPNIRRIVHKHELGEDTLCHRTPAMLIFHCKRDEVYAREMSWIALSHAMLAAEAEGLGSCILGLVAPAINRSVELGKMLNIPESNDVYCCLSMGYASESYHRTIPKKFGNVTYLDNSES